MPEVLLSVSPVPSCSSEYAELAVSLGDSLLAQLVRVGPAALLPGSASAAHFVVQLPFQPDAELVRVLRSFGRAHTDVNGDGSRSIVSAYPVVDHVTGARSEARDEERVTCELVRPCGGAGRPFLRLQGRFANVLFERCSREAAVLGDGGGVVFLPVSE